ncbi:MAG TPA: nuclear transport factor 2 family protein [Polyangiaceae bacterium]
MRRILPLLVPLASTMALSGCAAEQGQPPPLTPAQQADIGQQVLQQVHQDMRAWESLSVDETMKGVQDSPDFALVTPDGHSYGIAEFRKLWSSMAANASSEKITPHAERVIVLAPDAALYTSEATWEVFEKDGSVERYDVGAGTYLYRKVGDRWLLAYEHESAGQPTHVPSPGAASAPPPPPKRSMAEMQQAYLDAFVADVHDPAKLAALYAPNATILAAGSPAQEGTDAIRRAYQGMVDTYPDMALKPVRTWSKGSVLVVEAVATGTDKASAKPVGIDYLTVLTFGDDGLVANAHSYVDAVTLMKQTGAYKDKVPGKAALPLPAAPPQVHAARGDATEDANVANAKALDPRLKQQLHDKKDPGWKNTTLLGVEDFTIDEGEFSFTQNKRTVAGHGVEIEQWKDGKVVQSWSWGNEMEIDAQLGIGPAAPKAAQR